MDVELQILQVGNQRVQQTAPETLRQVPVVSGRAVDRLKVNEIPD